jgi:thiol:disulfide interchange protein DsbD
LKGDWTQQNPEITQVLSSFGRAGVPLYLVFPAHGAQAMVLPQLLTEAAVVQALNAPRS